MPGSVVNAMEIAQTRAVFLEHDPTLKVKFNLTFTLNPYPHPNFNPSPNSNPDPNEPAQPTCVSTTSPLNPPTPRLNPPAQRYRCLSCITTSV